MIKKNILGITIIILILAAFAVGYLVGKRSSELAPNTQAGSPFQQGQAWAGQPPAGQSGRPSLPETDTPDAQQQPQGQRPVDGRTMSQQPQEAQPEVSQTSTSTPVGQTFYGTVAPYDEVNVQSKQGGTITMLKGKEGDSVRRGEVIVRFDDSDTKLELEKAQSSKNATLQQVQQAESNFKTVQTNVERNQQLFQDGLISQQQMDDITNQLESTRAALNSARENVTQAEAQINLTKNHLKDFQVKAPISGIIDAKKYNLGEVYQAGGVIYHVINIDQIYVEIEVPETYLQQIREGMDVTVVFDALGDQTFSGVVDTILPTGTADNRNFTAKVLVQNPDHAIKSGMFARIELVLDDSTS